MFFFADSQHRLLTAPGSPLHCRQKQQEARQRVQAGLKAAVAAAHEAIEADDAAAVSKAVPAVVDPQYKVGW